MTDFWTGKVLQSIERGLQYRPPLIPNPEQPLLEESRTLVVSWNDYSSDVAVLASLIREVEVSFDCILAVARGGLVVAAMLGHWLDIREIYTVCAQSYQDRNGGRVQLLSDIPVEQFRGSRVLIVDDLIDRGETMQYCVGILQQHGVEHARAVLYTKSLLVEYYAQKIALGTWVRFPYELS